MATQHGTWKVDIMGCCGKSAGRILNKAINIGHGYANLATGRKCAQTDLRIMICQQCKQNTWLKMSEYADWFRRNGIELIKNAMEFEKTPPLLKMPQGPGRNNLFCRICKCYIPAKARVEKETCKLGKWPNPIEFDSQAKGKKQGLTKD